QIVVHRGLLREAEARALRTLERLREGFQDDEGHISNDGEDDAQPAAVAISDRLAQRLSAHRTAALQVELARHPQAALAAVVHTMVQAVFPMRRYCHYNVPLEMRLTVQDQIGRAH